MSLRALIVEDEILVALDLEGVLRDMGIEVVAIAADGQSAMDHSGAVDVALVDINLRDGQTGPAIGRALATEHGVRVIFVTANPSLLGDGIEGTTVVTKPFSNHCIAAAIERLTRPEANMIPPQQEARISG